MARPGPKGPEQAYLEEESLVHARTTVQALLEQLNPRYREAVQLRFFENRSREDCAQAMEVTVGNFDVILFRAIKRLKTLYERHVHE